MQRIYIIIQEYLIYFNTNKLNVFFYSFSLFLFVFFFSNWQLVNCKENSRKKRQKKFILKKCKKIDRLEWICYSKKNVFEENRGEEKVDEKRRERERERNTSRKTDRNAVKINDKKNRKQNMFKRWKTTSNPSMRFDWRALILSPESTIFPPQFYSKT